MFECEDTSAGFHDLFLNKYADSSGSAMDFFISDSMQDMLDIDIRAEVATVVGGYSEFTSLVNDLPSSAAENESNQSNSPFEEPDRWYVGEAKWTSTNEIYSDVGACVNPNSVMPLINSTLLNSSRAQINLNTTHLQRSPSPPLPSPKESKSHLTFSPNQIKIRSIDDVKRNGSNTQNILSIASQQQQQQQQAKQLADAVKKDLIADLKTEKQPITTTKILTAPPGTPVIPATIAGGNTIKLAPGLGGLTFANGMAYSKIKQSTIDGTKIIRTSNGSIVAQIKKESDTHHHHHHQHHINGSAYTTNGLGSPKMIARNVIPSNKTHIISNETHQHQTSSNTAIKSKIKVTQHELPKPPYSYSCLIAMALKNSRSGLLPVSEIYSFMCEHFPYFKTAPTGWKNSVRHNLSLNKCFEKIEKPATNGSQRKGCLWAMNPSKITKMDEEVLKWSRKDIMAIRQAMVHPEHLENLERGEMKHGSSGDSDGENDAQSDVEESSDLEGEIDERIIETPESLDDDEEEEKYDIELSNVYDTIDLGSSRVGGDSGGGGGGGGGGNANESIQIISNNGEVFEITDCEPSFVTKKARLDINYSIAPASVFEQQHTIQNHQQNSSQTNQQQQHQSRRKMQLVNRIV